VTQFKRPKGVVEATIDAWSGGRPGSWTHDTTKEWFIRGTEPGSRRAVDEPGLLYRIACGSWRVDPVKAELGPASWRDDVADWLSRARRGTGVVGRHDSATAYFWGERSWGGSLAGGCYRPRPQRESGDGGRDRGGDHKKKKEKPPKPGEPAPTPPPPTQAPAA
jgi:hypothetical protein